MQGLSDLLEGKGIIFVWRSILLGRQLSIYHCLLSQSTSISKGAIPQLLQCKLSQKS